LDTNNQGVIPVQELKAVVHDTSANLGLTKDEADTLLMDVSSLLSVKFLLFLG
jgi:Ca2+-binding EF-hand superfamily protein